MVTSVRALRHNGWLVASSPTGFPALSSQYSDEELLVFVVSTCERSSELLPTEAIHWILQHVVYFWQIWRSCFECNPHSLGITQENKEKMFILDGFICSKLLVLVMFCIVNLVGYTSYLLLLLLSVNPIKKSLTK